MAGGQLGKPHRYNLRSRARVASISSLQTNGGSTPTASQRTTAAASLSSPSPGETAFTPLSQLPPELRDKIWLLAMETRAVVVYHAPSSPHALITQSALIRERYPALLGTCREARLLTLPLYRSVFPEPSSAPLKWYLRPGLPHATLLAHAADIDFSTPKTIRHSFQRFLNRHAPHVEDASTVVATYRKARGVVHPAFLSPGHDITYFRRPAPLARGQTGAFRPGLLTPYHPSAKKI